MNFFQVVRFFVGKWDGSNGFQCTSMDFLTFSPLFFLRSSDLFWWLFLVFLRKDLLLR